MKSALLALWLAYSAPEIAGDSTCPTAAEVRELLAAMAGSATAKTADDVPLRRVYLSSTDLAVHIALLDSDGTLLAERTLDRSGTCSDMAEATTQGLA